MTAPNAELAYKVLDLAGEHEGHFDMANWAWDYDNSRGEPLRLEDLTGSRCGTTACLAGWTVALAGYAVDSNSNVYDAKGQCLDRKANDLAAEMLGLTDQQRDDLFYVATENVDSAVAEIFGPRPDGGA